MMTNPIAHADEFRAAQQLAYECVEAVAETLSPGDTEREACRRMRAYLAERGVREYLHEPFAWFGDRTALRFKTPLAFFPTRRALAPGMPFILDCAPVIGGCTADVGYTSALGECPVIDRMLDDLEPHRELIAAQAATRPLGEVYDAVVALARKQGYDIRHRAYPFGVLGHRVEKLAPGRSRITLGGFGARSLVAFGREALGGALTLWNDRFAAGKPLPHGLWAVEPHLGLRGFGAKFEEILVVDAAGARWLDDDLPHVRRWRRQHGAAA